MSILEISELFASVLGQELTGASLPVSTGRAEALADASITWYKCEFIRDRQFELFLGIPAALSSVAVTALPAAVDGFGRAVKERWEWEVSGGSPADSDPPEECEYAQLTVATEDASGEILVAAPAALLAALGTADPAPAPVARPSSVQPKYFDFLMGLDLPMKISFGSSKLPLSDILKLTTGSMVELNRRYNDPVEVVVNDRLLARGEVVEVDGNYGVRILELCDWP